MVPRHDIAPDHRRGRSAGAAQRAPWRTDMIETIRLAWPIALTQLGQIAMMTTDLALIGRLGEQAIAAVGLAHLILFVGFVLGMGPVSAVAPLAAQAFGARKPRLVRRSLRVGLWAAVIIGVPVNVAQLWGEEVLIAAGQSSETAALAARYLAGLTWSMIPAWCSSRFAISWERSIVPSRHWRSRSPPYPPMAFWPMP